MNAPISKHAENGAVGFDLWRAPIVVNSMRERVLTAFIAIAGALASARSKVVVSYRIGAQAARSSVFFMPQPAWLRQK